MVRWLHDSPDRKTAACVFNSKVQGDDKRTAIIINTGKMGTCKGQSVQERTVAFISSKPALIRGRTFGQSLNLRRHGLKETSAVASSYADYDCVLGMYDEVQ